MTYTIICDSCTDIIEKDSLDPHIVLIPLTLQVDDYFVTDDENFDQLDFINRVKNSPNCPKSACPSPQNYMEAYEQADTEMIFVVTLSEHLSGSYNAAVVGKQMYEEEYGTNKKIKVVGSDSAASGQANIALTIREMAEQGDDFETISAAIDDMVYQMHTYFVLETLDTLRKNGRLSRVQAFFASTLNIKPIMGADHGVIIKLAQERGINKALNRMVDIVIQELRKPSNELRICISHCNCPQRAQYVKQLLEQKAQFKEIYIADTKGVSTMYANDGGIILAV
ncbi:MAG: DegV family protein [Lachnospiraceae bacterium]